MNSSRSNIRATGYTLIELMLVLILLAAFAVVANKLFISSFLIKQDALQATNDLVQTDSLIRLIRSDVWGASAIHSDSPHRVTIQSPDGTVVRWDLSVTTFEDETEALITRTELIDGEEVTGDPLFAPPDLAFRAEGTELYLTAGSNTVRLTSMLNLLTEVGP